MLLSSKFLFFFSFIILFRSDLCFKCNILRFLQVQVMSLFSHIILQNDTLSISIVDVLPQTSVHVTLVITLISQPFHLRNELVSNLKLRMAVCLQVSSKPGLIFQHQLQVVQFSHHRLL